MRRRKNKRRSHAQREAQKWYHIRRKYGLTKDQWFAILTKQHSKCAVCGRTYDAIKKSKNPNKSYRTMSVDHCHKTGAIRGLLCGNCNANILPSINEDIEIARRLLKYLSKTDHHGIVPDHKEQEQLST